VATASQGAVVPSIISNGCNTTSSAPPEIDRYVRPEEHAVAESVIRWCIERYYGSAPRGD